VWQLQPFGKEEVMNITIVGAMGLVGSQLVSLAKRRGHEVIALDLHR
jgi:putative NADH-flavin reductase